MSRKVDRTKLTQLYARGGAADEAYIVTRGPLFLGIDEVTLQRIPGDNIVVGTMEYLLSLQEAGKEQHTRVFDLYLHPRGDYSSVPMETVEEMIQQFHFGYNTNIFLARVLEASNVAFALREKRMSKLLRAYQRRARLLVKMVDILFDLGTRHDIPSVKDLAVSCREHEMYQDGTVYGRPQVMHAIVSPPSARSRFIELYKRNTLICREGNIGKQLYILLNGRISVSIEGTYVASIHAPGEAFGELSLFLEGRRTATLVAEEDTNVYVVEHKNIRQFVRHNSPRLFFSTAESLTQRIMHNVRRIRRMEQMARGGKGEEVIQLQSAPVEELGKAEIASLVSQLRILHEADPHPVLRGYLKQYETEAS